LLSSEIKAEAISMAKGGKSITQTSRKCQSAGKGADNVVLLLVTEKCGLKAP